MLPSVQIENKIKEVSVMASDKVQVKGDLCSSLMLEPESDPEQKENENVIVVDIKISKQHLDKLNSAFLYSRDSKYTTKRT